MHRFVHRIPRFTAAFSLAALPMTVACTGAGEDEAEEIGSSIEEVNGGLDMENEAPAFGDEAAFDAAELEADTPVEDPMESDPDVAADMSADAALVYAVTIAWGQMPPDRSNETPRDWSGTLSVNRGAILVRRTIGFEDRTDALLPRTDRASLSFTSVTRPFADGLRLAVVDPTPGADEPMALTYTADSGETFSATLTSLVGGPQSLEVDDAGNRVVAVAMPHIADPCNHGFLRGRWHRVADGRGRLIGQVANDEGELVGHMRGFYGRRASGEKVFFGKYIDLDGEFKGLFVGRYDAGSFTGRWLTRAGEQGVLGGEYRESIPGPETGGHFLGRWAERTCNIELPR